jgi:hypothetical protein
MVLSSLPLAIMLPSGFHVTALTALECPVTEHMGLAVYQGDLIECVHVQFGLSLLQNC